MMAVRRLAMVGVALALVLGVDALRRLPLPQASSPKAKWHDAVGDASHCRWSRADRRVLPMPPGVKAAHASQLLVLPPSHPDHDRTVMMAFWFAGTRESAADVNLVASRLDRATREWSPAFTVVDRHEARRALGVRLRRLGNPVAWADAQGRLHLFVVGTGLGGWAASRVVHLQENAQQLQGHWRPLRVLPLMPLVPSLNTSVLVRTAPLPLDDGGALLPVYFELGMKYSAVVRLGPDGEMQALQRITRRHDVLQPALLPLSAQHWLAFHRNQGPSNQLGVSTTQDAGAHWQDMPHAPFSNADSSIAALRTQDGLSVLVHNPAEQGRRTLLWSQSTQPADPASWRTQAVIEGGAGEEYSYPSLAEVPASATSGVSRELWLSYTHRRQAIAVERWQAACGGAR
jgi:predicted neuraminidase